MLFTNNLFRSASEGSLLPLIIFSIMFAGVLTTMGDRVSRVTALIVQVNEALLSFVLFLMKLAPVGIFCLVTARFGEAQQGGGLVAVLVQTGSYFVTVLVGLAVHALLTLPLIPLDLHQAQPDSLHDPDVTGLADRLLHRQFERHAADLAGMRGWQREGIEAVG